MALKTSIVECLNVMRKSQVSVKKDPILKHPLKSDVKISAEYKTLLPKGVNTILTITGFAFCK